MRVDRFIKWTVFFLSGEAHARRPLHKMDGVFFLSGDAHARRPLHKIKSVFLSGDAHARRPLHKMDGVFLSGDAHARRPLHKMDGVFFFFFVLSVSCWNIRFGAICHFRPTNSSSSTENCESCSLISPNLNLQDHFLASI